MIELLGTQTEANQRSQQEYDDEFGRMTRLIRLNSELAVIVEERSSSGARPGIFEPDLQAESIARLTAERDAILSEILQNPEAAFAHEFELLSRLYVGRMSQDTDTLGNTYEEFVTRDPSRQKADLHFRRIEYVQGSQERVVEVPGDSPDQSPYYISLKGDALRLATTVYERGRYQRVELDPVSGDGTRMLMNFFSHSITASDLMYNRQPAEIAEADAQARLFLHEKIQRQRNY